MSESIAEAAEQGRTYKMMVNIHLQPKDRTRYVKMLERVTSNPYVTYMKLILSMIIATVVIITAFTLIVSAPGLKLKYTAIWVVLGATGCLIFVVMYALPSRNMSLLAALTRLTLITRLANSLAKRRPVLPCLGIDKIATDQDGFAVLRFVDGGIGRVMKVSGCIGLSTLPAIAEGITQLRSNYLLARKSTTQEQLITVVRQAQFKTQLLELRRLYNLADTGGFNNGSEQDNQWRAFMANSMYEYMFDTLRGSDSIIEQYLILRETDGKNLRKAMSTLETSVNEGLYSACRLMTCDEFCQLTRLLTSSHVAVTDIDTLPTSAGEPMKDEN